MSGEREGEIEAQDYGVRIKEAAGEILKEGHWKERTINTDEW